MLKRRKNLKTDYRQRLALLKSGSIRVVIRKSHNNIRIQFVKYEKTGDKTLVDEISKNLRKYGWKAHCGSLPAAYLTGLAAGCKAAKKDIKKAVSDIGLQVSIKGSVLYACLKGINDAGIDVPIGDAVPKKERIEGKHIAEYAQKLRSDEDKYKKQFSAYIKAGLNPEELSNHFEQVKKKISEDIVKETSESKVQPSRSKSSG